MKLRILITGGQGFVGKALVANALTKGFTVRVSSRQRLTSFESCLEFFQVKDLGSSTDWFAALKGVDAVVHCAGRAHVIKETAEDPLAAFRAVNLDGTLNLARKVAAAGVKRFV
jgi:UDP-glucose 4-epimerase